MSQHAAHRAAVVALASRYAYRRLLQWHALRRTLGVACVTALTLRSEGSRTAGAAAAVQLRKRGRLGAVAGFLGPGAGRQVRGGAQGLAGASSARRRPARVAVGIAVQSVQPIGTAWHAVLRAAPGFWCQTDGSSAQGTAQFSGHFSTEIADDETKMQRSGFCGIHTLVRSSSLSRRHAARRKTTLSAATLSWRG